MSSTISEILMQARLDGNLLDVEVLLANVLGVSRALLLAFDERKLNDQEAALFASLILQYKKGMPVAYLTGHREFWSLDLIVTQDVLIPRPETELLVERMLSICEEDAAFVADLGTGSGAIALAIAKERPMSFVYATDNSQAALRIARCNAERIGLSNVLFFEGEWCNALPRRDFSAIVSNPPYIARTDSFLCENVRHYEPSSAWMAEENGLCDLREIIESSRAYLKAGGTLFVEHGFRQGDAVRTFFKAMRYEKINTDCDLAGHERITYGSIGCL